MLGRQVTAWAPTCPSSGQTAKAQEQGKGGRTREPGRRRGRTGARRQSPAPRVPGAGARLTDCSRRKDGSGWLQNTLSTDSSLVRDSGGKGGNGALATFGENAYLHIFITGGIQMSLYGIS